MLIKMITISFQRTFLFNTQTLKTQTFITLIPYPTRNPITRATRATCSHNQASSRHAKSLNAWITQCTRSFIPSPFVSSNFKIEFALAPHSTLLTHSLTFYF